ncbi:hypothetical protein CEXT_57741 [Caerostris extrusa]|uniref:Uncharacterized protein n=1 Tax=Caerostris extrusa TaxID=172846 RepID=A0AAV4XKK2_CAEEX|nr:hypothetical protein CEXT_57741 [Caerostris extrusa]
MFFFPSRNGLRSDGSMRYPYHSSLGKVKKFENEEQVTALYELSDDPRRKEFLDDLFRFMQNRDPPNTFHGIFSSHIKSLYRFIHGRPSGIINIGLNMKLLVLPWKREPPVLQPRITRRSVPTVVKIKASASDWTEGYPVGERAKALIVAFVVNKNYYTQAH